MSATFTPGPWSFSHRKTPAGLCSTQVYCKAGRTIATIDWYPMPRTPEGVTGTYREVNARLIAAAPDLLEALILLEAEMVLSGNAGSEDYGWKPAIEKTRAAIARATGEPT